MLSEFSCLRYPTESAKVLCFWAACLSVRSFICPDKYCYHDISWMSWAVSMKLNREYSLAPTGDLNRFWRSKVKVTAGRWWLSHPRRHLGVEVHILVWNCMALQWCMYRTLVSEISWRVSVRLAHVMCVVAVHDGTTSACCICSTSS